MSKYTINNHSLAREDGTPVSYSESPNHGGQLEPRFLIIHFTAGADATSSINWFMNPTAKASAHLVIGRDGAVTQMVPFNVVAWHAGKSEWSGLVGLNRHSIGIELDNAGKLTESGGRWRSWFGRYYESDQVTVAKHPNETAVAGWHNYTELQIASLVDVANALHQKYAFEGILGHEDISPGRKVDPGPAFPMQSFKAKILGRMEDE